VHHCVVDVRTFISIIDGNETPIEPNIQNRNILQTTSRVANCCEFNACHGSEVAIGTELGLDIISMDEIRQPSLPLSVFGHVLSLAFDRTCPHILYTGTKHKRILLFDKRLRAPSVCTVSMGGVCNLYLTNDARYLVSSDFSGKIDKYDVRAVKKDKAVVSYPGHVNDYRIASFGVDEREDFLYAVGSDSQTRLWDFPTGELLRTLPAPQPVAPNYIPSACFSQCLAEPCSRPGVIVGMGRKQLFLYSL
jgi:WD40 repeat protein